jgi:hypothetical protein
MSINNAFYSTVQLGIGIMVMLFNLLILIVIHKGKLYKKTSYYNLVYLAFSDLFYGVAMFTRGIAKFVLYNNGNITVCRMFTSLIGHGVLTSFSGIFLLSLELLIFFRKMHAVNFRGLYKTSIHAWVAFGCVNLICILLLLPAIVFREADDHRIEFVCSYTNKYVFNTKLFVTVPIYFLVTFIITTALLMTSVVIVLRKRQLPILRAQSSVGPSRLSVPSTQQSNTNSSQPTLSLTVSHFARAQPPHDRYAMTSSASSERISTNTTMNKTLSRNKRLITIVLVIWACYTLTWGPFIVMFTLKDGFGVYIPPALFSANGYMLSINALINIFIYTWKSKDFREHFLNLMPTYLQKKLRR